MLKILDGAILSRIREAHNQVKGSDDYAKYVMECYQKGDKKKWHFVGHNVPVSNSAKVRKYKDEHFIIEETSEGTYKYVMNEAVRELIENELSEDEHHIMSEQEIKVFNDLLNNPDFKGKNTLKFLLWKNTVKPKFKVGECFKVTNLSHYVYGRSVIDFKAKIVKVYSLNMSTVWNYELEMIIRCNGKESIVKEYVRENELLIRAADNINEIIPANDSMSSRFM